MNKETLTLGSLFSGSGGFELAGMLSGIKPVWNSEIEPFAIRVTTKRLPEVRHFGDVSKLSGRELPPVDVITFGSPCQDMSIAGKREGLHGERSGLFHEAIRIIKEMREETNGEKPRYIVWENVPGAFSSNAGADFKSVLEAVIGIKEPACEVPAPGKNGWPYADVYLGDGWSVAYRLLDAQFWGVPQRRARIFLVADFGGERAGDILFKSEGLSGYSAEGFEAWKRAAGNPEGSFRAAGGICLNDQGGERMEVSEGVSGTLRAQDHGHPPVVMAAGFCTEHSAASRSIGYEDETSPTLRAGVVPAAIALEHHPADSRIGIEDGCTIQTLTSRMGTGGGNVPLVMAPDEAVPFGISSASSHAMLSDNPHAGIYEARTSRTLDLNGGNPGCSQGGIAVVEKAYPIEGNGQRPSHKGDGWNDSDTMYTLNATEKHGVAAPVYHGGKASYLTRFSDDPALDTLVATDYKEPPVVSHEPFYIVRRLTPTECARLQGFPDWWCKGLETEKPTEEDIAFWTEVFETYRETVTKAKKPKTDKQIIKWLKNPHLDSAEYRLWGNGVALPCVWFVLSGIVYYDQLSH